MHQMASCETNSQQPSSRLMFIQIVHNLGDGRFITQTFFFFCKFAHWKLGNFDFPPLTRMLGFRIIFIFFFFLLYGKNRSNRLELFSMKHFCRLLLWLLNIANLELTEFITCMFFS